MDTPDTFKVDRLTNEKASHIAIRDSYHVTGYVLTRVVGAEAQKCIVDCSAVRWMGMTEFFRMMHPPHGPADTIVQQYKHTAVGMTPTLTVNDAWVRSADYNTATRRIADLEFKLAMLKTVKRYDVNFADSDSDAADAAAAWYRGWNQCLDAVQAALEFKP